VDGRLAAVHGRFQNWGDFKIGGLLRLCRHPDGLPGIRGSDDLCVLPPPPSPDCQADHAAGKQAESTRFGNHGKNTATVIQDGPSRKGARIYTPGAAQLIETVLIEVMRVPALDISRVKKRLERAKVRLIAGCHAFSKRPGGTGSSVPGVRANWRQPFR